MSALFGCTDLDGFRAIRRRAKFWRKVRRLAGLAAWIVLGGSVTFYAVVWAALRWAA